jgi:flagellar hook-basal body complex protein FliE
MKVKGLDAIVPGEPGAPGPVRPADGDGPEFGAVLRESLSEVNRLQGEADVAVEALATGKGISLHDTMIALEKADLSFRLMMQVRNKIVAAYREILSMQV